MKTDLRLAALRRFALSISALVLAGHLFLGFEQAPVVVLVAALTAYACELLFELASAWSRGQRPRFLGGPGELVSFLLPPHITAMTISMMLYSNERLVVIAFASAVAVGSKYLLRAPVGRDRPGTRHFLNPSNTGISVTLLLFPWVGMAPPYQFSAGLFGAFDLVLPVGICVLGTLLTWKFTKKGPLVVAWLGAFLLQAVLRWLFLDASLHAALVPMTGPAFVLFTFYMLPDPGTSPFRRRGQLVFGAAVAMVYGVLQAFHIVFGLFFALTLVCVARGAWMAAVVHVPVWMATLERALRPRPLPIPAPAMMEEVRP